MVKRQKEKQYQSATEHRQNSQIRSGSSSSYTSTSKALPFNCCALTLTPYENPVCTPNGIIFESNAITQYLLKYKKDPVTGEEMTSKDLITLCMDKEDEKWQCPVLCKPFMNHTKIVAVRQNPPGNEANVYSYEAVQELNLKPKNYLDLISGKKFHRTKDIIILHDPTNVEFNKLKDIHNFKHVQSLRDGKNQDLASGGGGGGSSNNVRLSVTASRVMNSMKRKREEEEKKTLKLKNKNEKDTSKEEGKKLKVFSDEVTGIQMTSGKTAGSFTSTSMSLSYTNETREATKEEILQSQFDTMKKMKQKGFVRLLTNMGEMDLELHCDIAPRTCMNFIGLVEQGKYNGTVFHRSIRNFMIQGGKPPKKEGKESSLWGEPFVDEFDDRLKHQGPGILSMANAGPNTNKMQFFITYKSAPHLDRKHSVFGSVAKGMEVLKEMECVETDKRDKPRKEIVILEAIVFGNPVKEAEEKERIRIEKKIKEKNIEKESRRAWVSGKPKAQQLVTTDSASGKDDASSSQIGKYLPKPASKEKKKKKQNEVKSDIGGFDVKSSRLSKPPKKTTFGDFSGW